MCLRPVKCCTLKARGQLLELSVRGQDLERKNKLQVTPCGTALSETISKKMLVARSRAGDRRDRRFPTRLVDPSHLSGLQPLVCGTAFRPTASCMESRMVYIKAQHRFACLGATNLPFREQTALITFVCPTCMFYIEETVRRPFFATATNTLHRN